MDFDDISLSAYEELQREWFKPCSLSNPGICQLADRHRQRDDCLLRSMHCGSFNFSIRLHWDDGGEDWVIRSPMLGKSMVLDEKVHREAMLMKYIAKETDIPVPKVICHGKAADNLTDLGTLIIMTWVEGKKLSDMPDILVSLWSLEFDRIGSIREDGQHGKLVINGRPLIQEENELIRFRHLYSVLLELQSTQLKQQRNSVNVLVNDSLEVVAVIDWEFCYAAPLQFAANYIVDDLGPRSFFDAFLPKVDIFLQALKEREEARGLSKQDKDTRLSALMRRSIEDRSAWFMLACRKVASVDLIYWDMLDECCWGPRSSMAERSHAFTGTGELHKGREDFPGENSDVVYEPPTPPSKLQSAICPRNDN
ncbi:hypothetical protein BDW69DRAFT_200067 [Aspergillus filifer]